MLYPKRDGETKPSSYRCHNHPHAERFRLVGATFSIPVETLLAAKTSSGLQQCTSGGEFCSRDVE
jgi:hypothetical protein